MMAKNEKGNWMIGIGNSDADGVFMERVFGTKAQVRQYLAGCVRRDKAEDEEGFDYGSTSPKDVQEQSDGTLQAYAVFGNCHIDYTAKPEPVPKDLAHPDAV